MEDQNKLLRELEKANLAKGSSAAQNEIDPRYFLSQEEYLLCWLEAEKKYKQTGRKPGGYRSLSQD